MLVNGGARHSGFRVTQVGWIELVWRGFPRFPLFCTSLGIIEAGEGF